MIPQELIGTIPGWITSASAVALLIGFWRHRAALRVIANTRVATDNARDEDIRTHYADELARVIQRQRDCEQREEALRQRVADLEDEVTGLKRQIVQYSAETMAELSRIGCPRVKTPHAAAAAERVQKITGEGK